jgi:hypothetical protein
MVIWDFAVIGLISYYNLKIDPVTDLPVIMTDWVSCPGFIPITILQKEGRADERTGANP